MFFVRLLHLYDVPAVPRTPHHLSRRGWRYIERVRRDQVERSPCGHFPRARRLKAYIGVRPTSKCQERPLGSRRLQLNGSGLRPGQTNIIVLILADPVDHRANIKSLHPRIDWAIVVEAKISAVPWQRARQGESRR